MANISVPEPFPISLVANHYFLYDVDTVSYVRRKYHICGVLIGTIPHLSQQNVFLGLPLELMPEEARLLVEQGHAYILDDVEAHKAGFLWMSNEERQAFMQVMQKQGLDAARESQKKQEARKEKHFKGQAQLEKANKPPELTTFRVDEDAEADAGLSLFNPSSTHPSNRPQNIAKLEQYFVTPAISQPPLPTPSEPLNSEFPAVPRTYSLFAYLHSKGYYMTPGLRFGCNYTVYPGDPLRFHSHFLASGMNWDEEFDLLDIVGGGRLGTAVKKAFLIGGADLSADVGSEDKDVPRKDGVRAFSIEWASM